MPILMTIWEGTRYESPNIRFGVKMYLNITIMSFVGGKQILFNWRKKLEKTEMAMTRMRRLSRPLRPICFPEMSDPTYLHFPCTLPHILQNSPPLLWKTCLTPLITAPHLRSVHPWFPVLTSPPRPTCNNLRNFHIPFLSQKSFRDYPLEYSHEGKALKIPQALQMLSRSHPDCQSLTLISSFSICQDSYYWFVKPA